MAMPSPFAHNDKGEYKQAAHNYDPPRGCQSRSRAQIRRHSRVMWPVGQEINKPLSEQKPRQVPSSALDQHQR